MTTGFRNASGTDFDNVFDPYVQGTKPGATGFRTSDGVDLNQRFAPIVFGTAAAATGFRLSGGADVNTLWAAKGTASYLIPSPAYDWTMSVPQSGTSFYTISNPITWHSNGTWSTSVASGNWATSPSAGFGNSYQIMLDNFVLNNNAGQTLTLLSNSLSSWVTVSADRAAVMQLVSRPSSVGSTWTCRVQIRRVSDSVVVYTGTISGALTVNNA